MKRKNLLMGAGAAVLLTLAAVLAVHYTDGTWTGVDESVVEKVAEAAGRPAREPILNTDQGDLLLLVFLLGGAAGGFLMGYYFREVFGARRDSQEVGWHGHAPLRDREPGAQTETRSRNGA